MSQLSLLPGNQTTDPSHCRVGRLHIQGDHPLWWESCPTTNLPCAWERDGKLTRLQEENDKFNTTRQSVSLIAKKKHVNHPSSQIF